MTLEFGKGFDKSSLFRMIQFYEEFPEYVWQVCGDDGYMPLSKDNPYDIESTEDGIEVTYFTDNCHMEEDKEKTVFVITEGKITEVIPEE